MRTRSVLRLAPLFASLSLASPVLAGGCPCPGNLDGNGSVDAADLAILLGAWGSKGGSADLNGDGHVAADDLAILLGAWGPCPNSPDNDHCGDALVLPSVVSQSVPFCTFGADTDGPDLPNGACSFQGYAQIGSDVWYRVTAPASGYIGLSTCSADFDTKLALYGPGAFGTLCPSGFFPAEFLACNDDYSGPNCPGSLTSRLFAPVNGGTTYSIRLGGHAALQGTGNLDVDFYAPHDLCIDCEPVDVTCPGNCSATRFGSNLTATDVPSVVVTTCGGADASRDVWYCVHVNCANGIPLLAEVSTCHPGTNFDTVVTVFSGSCDNLTEVACNDDADDPSCVIAGLNRKSKLLFSPTQGATYLVRVAGYNGATGNFEISFTLGCTVGP